MVPRGDAGVSRYWADLQRFDTHVHFFDVPAWAHQGLMQPRAKLWALEASPFTTNVIYENDFLFQGSIKPLFDLGGKLGFGMSWCRGLRWGAPWTLRALREPGWNEFPCKATLSDGTAKVYNNGMLYVDRNHPFTEAWRERYETWRRWFDNGTAFPLGEEVICNILGNDNRDKIGELWAELPEIYNQDVRRVSHRTVSEGVALHYVAQSHIRQRGRRQDSRERWRNAFREVVSSKPGCLDGLLTWDLNLAEQIKTGDFKL
jgi:hypothetical protein